MNKIQKKPLNKEVQNSFSYQKFINQIKKNYNSFEKFIDLLNYYVNATLKINTKVMLQSHVRNLIKNRFGDDSCKTIQIP